MDNFRFTTLCVFASSLVVSGCFNPPNSECESDACAGTEGSADSSGTTTTTAMGDSETSAADSSSSGGDETFDSSGTTTGDEGPAPAECGNGRVEEEEECDEGEGNGDEPDACRGDCVLASCGDGIVDTGEQCDSEADDCLPDCTFDTIEFGPFPTATVAIGQPDLNSNTPNALGYIFSFPNGVLSHDGNVYIPNGQGAGTFIFNGVPAVSGVAPDDVLGRPGLQQPANAFGASSLGGFVHGLSVDDGQLVIADPEGPRVLVFDGVPTTDTPADVVTGQPNFDTQQSGVTQDRLSDARDVFVANDRMVVADTAANRVLVWNTLPGVNGALPVVVLGQANFDEGEANRGGDPAADTLAGPSGVWTDGSRIAVADTQNHRVLVWDAFPTENGQPADHVIGQADMTGGDPGGGADGFNRPQDLMFVGNRMYVADQLNHRIMLFDGWPGSDGSQADGVIGQSNFDNLASNDDDQDGASDEVPSGRTLARPVALHVDGGRLFVADAFNHRVVVFEGT